MVCFVSHKTLDTVTCVPLQCLHKSTTVQQMCLIQKPIGTAAAAAPVKVDSKNILDATSQGCIGQINSLTCES